jgi:hypothetical protein
LGKIEEQMQLSSGIVYIRWMLSLLQCRSSSQLIYSPTQQTQHRLYHTQLPLATKSTNQPLQHAYFANLHSPQRRRPRGRHRSPPQPRADDQDPLPIPRKLRLRVWRRSHLGHLHRDGQEAHWSGTSLSLLPPILRRQPNLTRAQTTYKLTLTNTPTGVDSLVNAKPPVGILTIAGQWRVADGKLSEDVEIDGNFMMKKMAKGNVEKTHPEQHTKLIEAAQC